MTRDMQREQGLRLYLVGDHEQLYYRSPSFHHAIEQLAAWLPLWVDAMATAAVQTDEDMRQRAEDVKRLLGQRLGHPMVLSFDPASAEAAPVLLGRDEAGRLTIIEPVTDTSGQPVTGGDARAVANFAAELRAVNDLAAGSDALVDGGQLQADTRNVQQAHLDQVRAYHERQQADRDALAREVLVDERNEILAYQHDDEDCRARHMTGSRSLCGDAGCPCHCHVPHTFETSSKPYRGCKRCGRGPFAQVHKRTDGPAADRMRCPDGGKCHHECTERCWRVSNAGPLSGVYPDDEWPDDVDAAHLAPVPDDEPI